VLADSPHIANLKFLSLVYTTIGLEGAGHLARAKHLQGLTDLLLTRNELGDEGLRTLCQAPQFANVERLLLEKNELGPDAAAILAEGVMSKLRWLDLRSNPLGESGITALVDAGQMEQIEWLNLGWCELTSQAVQTIFSGGGGARLRWLSLRGNEQLDAKACAPALAGNALPQLRALRLELKGKASKKVGKAFADAAWWPQLENFTLLGNSWPSLGPYVAQTRLDNLVQLHVVNSTDKKVSPAECDETIGLLARNPSLQKLQLLEAHLPLTENAIEPFTQFTRLRRLAIPPSLRPHVDRIKSALPKCRVEFTTSSS
jgi:hypothetical protein